MPPLNQELLADALEALLEILEPEESMDDTAEGGDARIFLHQLWTVVDGIRNATFEQIVAALYRLRDEGRLELYEGWSAFEKRVFAGSGIPFAPGREFVSCELFDVGEDSGQADDNIGGGNDDEIDSVEEEEEAESVAGGEIDNSRDSAQRALFNADGEGGVEP